MKASVIIWAVPSMEHAFQWCAAHRVEFVRLSLLVCRPLEMILICDGDQTRICSRTEPWAWEWESRLHTSEALSENREVLISEHDALRPLPWHRTQSWILRQTWIALVVSIDTIFKTALTQRHDQYQNRDHLPTHSNLLDPLSCPRSARMGRQRSESPDVSDKWHDALRYFDVSLYLIEQSVSYRDVFHDALFDMLSESRHTESQRETSWSRHTCQLSEPFLQQRYFCIMPKSFQIIYHPVHDFDLRQIMDNFLMSDDLCSILSVRTLLITKRKIIRDSCSTRETFLQCRYHVLLKPVGSCHQVFVDMHSKHAFQRLSTSWQERHGMNLR